MDTDKDISKSFQPDIKWLTWLVLPQVIMSGWAFDQVEIPQLIYTTYGYFSTIVYLIILLSNRIRFPFKILLAIPAVYFFVNFFWSISIGILSIDLLTTILIGELLLLNRKSKIWIFIKFRCFLIFMCSCGILCFLSFTLNLGLPYQILDYYSTTQENAFYVNYHISYIYFDGEHMLYRLCGLYNEPGFLGTVTALCLIIENFNLSRFGNIIILIAGILTLSVAFWALITIYFCFRNIKNLKYIIGTCAFIGIVYIIVQKYNSDNILIQSVIERFEYKDGKFKGNNRTSDKFDTIYDKYIASDKIYFGEGTDAKERFQITDTSSYKIYIFRFGFFGFILLWATPFLLSLQYSGKNLKCILYIACFFISTYQRPNFYNSLYMMLLFGGIDYIKLILTPSKKIELYNDTKA